MTDDDVIIFRLTRIECLEFLISKKVFQREKSFPPVCHMPMFVEIHQIMIIDDVIVFVILLALSTFSALFISKKVVQCEKSFPTVYNMPTFGEL